MKEWVLDEQTGRWDYVEQPKTAFTHDDGSTYERVDPAAFPSYDEVDSRQIVDDGAPD